jgi:hypothetical protein
LYVRAQWDDNTRRQQLLEGARLVKPGKAKKGGATDEQKKWAQEKLRQEWMDMDADGRSPWEQRAKERREQTAAPAGAASGSQKQDPGSKPENTETSSPSTTAAGSTDTGTGGVSAHMPPCSSLSSWAGRQKRLDPFRSAWDAAAGTRSAEELAYVVHHALPEDEKKEFFAALQKLAAPQQALEKALYEEVQQHPEQTARSALARAASHSGVARKTLRPGAGAGVRISAKFMKKAQQQPQRGQSQQGGRKRMLDRPELITLVRDFLRKHSKETERFCRTKARHRKAMVRYTLHDMVFYWWGVGPKVGGHAWRAGPKPRPAQAEARPGKAKFPKPDGGRKAAISDKPR